MAFRAVAMRLGAKRGAFHSRSLQSRAFSDGKMLSDEERAAETMYIKKMEKEKLEKAKQGIKVEESAAAGDSSSGSGSSSIPERPTGTWKIVAVFGIAGLLALGVGYARSGGSTKQEEKK
eukprot:c12533_g1_i1 orf=205-564(+)